MDVLQKREDAKTICNDSLTNFDQTYVGSAVHAIGCIPHYWMGLIKRYSILKMFNSKILLCETQNQLFRANQYLTPQIEKGLALFTPPCRQMKVTLDMETSDYAGPGLLGIRIDFGSENYKLFRNVRSYGIYDLVSQVGGIIGMVLGFSFMQQAPSFLQSVSTPMEK